jgi:hypothetical protein
MTKHGNVFMNGKKAFAVALLCGIAITNISASNLADPAVLVPAARLSVGASYDLDGFSITNDTVHCITNRFQARLSYSPFPFVNFGIDAGLMQMEVASDTTPTDTFSVFHGKYGICGGAHLKLGTPFFYNDLVGAVGIFEGTYFSSKNDAGAMYGGLDANGGVGIQFHVPNFGYITAGPSIYLIYGRNRSYTGLEGRYSNVNNIRGWLAIDYFPTMAVESKNLLYISLEVTVEPKATFNERAPIQEMSVSVSIGSITKRLYGQPSEVEWKP